MHFVHTYIYNSYTLLALEHDECPILHHALYTLPYDAVLSKCTHRITADDLFDSERWNKDSSQSLIMSMCVCVCVVRTYF